MKTHQAKAVAQAALVFPPALLIPGFYLFYLKMWKSTSFILLLIMVFCWIFTLEKISSKYMVLSLVILFFVHAVSVSAVLAVKGERHERV